MDRIIKEAMAVGLRELDSLGAVGEFDIADLEKNLFKESQAVPQAFLQDVCASCDHAG